MPTTLTLTTWNVQNLFRPAPGAGAASVGTYDAKISLVAQTIRSLDPDVVALQEVGGDDALADLQSAIPAYAHRHLGTADARGIACAFLSKLPLQIQPEILEFPDPVLELGLVGLDGEPLERMGRGAPRVRVVKSGFACDIIAVHLKSKLLTFPGGKFSTTNELLRAKVAALALMRRTAEAAAVRLAVSNLIADDKGAAVAVLGDFNDSAEAATTQILQGPEGSEIGTGGFHRPDVGDTVRMWNLAERIEEGRRYSRIHHGHGELLDHIFVSEEFLPPGEDDNRRLPVSVDSAVENIRSIGDNPQTTIPRPDHAPVTATFEID